MKIPLSELIEFQDYCVRARRNLPGKPEPQKMVAILEILKEKRDKPRVTNKEINELIPQLRQNVAARFMLKGFLKSKGIEVGE